MSVACSARPSAVACLLALLAVGAVGAFPSAAAAAPPRWPLPMADEFADDSTHFSNVHDADPPSDASAFHVPLSTRPASVAKRGGQLTFLWAGGPDRPNPLFDAELNLAVYEGRPGNTRELHWHPDASEWAQVVAGQCFTTMMDPDGKIANNDLKVGDVWYFPRNWPHAVQAGTSGCKAVLFFNSPEWIPTNDFGISQLVTLFPSDYVAANLGLSQSDAKAIQDQLIGVAGETAPILLSMAEVPSEVWPVPHWEQSPYNPTWHFLSQEPKLHYGDSYVQQLFQSTFDFAEDICGEYDTMAAGVSRAIHWHINGGEMQYVVKGTLEAAVVSFGGKSVTHTLSQGDVGWVPVGFAHSYKCASEKPCEVLLAWNTGNLQTIEMGAWLRNSPQPVVASNLNITAEQLSSFSPPDIFTSGTAYALLTAKFAVSSTN